MRRICGVRGVVEDCGGRAGDVVSKGGQSAFRGLDLLWGAQRGAEVGNRRIRRWREVQTRLHLDQLGRDAANGRSIRDRRAASQSGVRERERLELSDVGYVREA